MGFVVFWFFGIVCIVGVGFLGVSVGYVLWVKGIDVVLIDVLFV